MSKHNLRSGHSSYFSKFLFLALILSETKFNQSGFFSSCPQPERAVCRFQGGYKVLMLVWVGHGYVWSRVTQAASIPAWSPFAVHSNSYTFLIQTTHTLTQVSLNHSSQEACNGNFSCFFSSLTLGQELNRKQDLFSENSNVLAQFLSLSPSLTFFSPKESVFRSN